MTHDRAIELLKIERECINRNNQSFGENCDRNCGKCDLVQNTEELLNMYDYVINFVEKEGIRMNKCPYIVGNECDIDRYNTFFDRAELSDDSNSPTCNDCILDRTDACSRGGGRAVDDEICESFLKEGANNGEETSN